MCYKVETVFGTLVSLVMGCILSKVMYRAHKKNKRFYVGTSIYKFCITF